MSVRSTFDVSSHASPTPPTTAENDDLLIAGRRFRSRFILGSGKFSLDLMRDVVESGRVEIATAALRRANVGGHGDVLSCLPAGVTVLPNTSGARTAEEAIRIARLARELTGGDLVKLEVVPDAKHLLPDNHETIRAVEVLAARRFRRPALHVSGY